MLELGSMNDSVEELTSSEETIEQSQDLSGVIDGASEMLEQSSSEIQKEKICEKVNIMATQEIQHNLDDSQIVEQEKNNPLNAIVVKSMDKNSNINGESHKVLEISGKKEEWKEERARKRKEREERQQEFEKRLKREVQLVVQEKKPMSQD